MNYIGTDPREGMALIAETTASNDSAVNFDGVFNNTYNHYFIEILDCDAGTDDVALEFSLRNGGSAITGSTKRGKWWGFTDTTGGSSASLTNQGMRAYLQGHALLCSGFYFTNQ